MIIAKIKIYFNILAFLTLFASTVFIFNPVVSAAEIPAGCPGSTMTGPPGPGVCEAIPVGCPGALTQGAPTPGTSCPYTQPEPINDDSGDGDGDTSTIDTKCNETPLTRDNCEIINMIVVAINVLTAIAGMAIIASIMIAGFQYMTAQDNAGQIEKAKSRIIMAILALALLIFMFALLNFLVPGGVL